MAIKFKLLQEHKGSQAVESVILAPLMFTTFVILMYFWFMGMTYITYNNLANNIAQELNMGITGYRNLYPTTLDSDIMSYTVIDDTTKGKRKYLTQANLTIDCNSGSNEVIINSALNAALNKYKEGFAIPFNEVKDVRVYTNGTITNSNVQKGQKIEIVITYSTTVFGGSLSIPMKATGYAIIM